MKTINYKIFNICFFTILFLVFSCNKEEIINDNKETLVNKDICIQNGRAVFKNDAVYQATLEKLSGMETDEKIAWAKEVGFKSYLMTQQPNMVMMVDTTEMPVPEDLSDVVPEFYSPVFNVDKEVQVGDTIIWRHFNTEYWMKGADNNLLRRLQKDVKAGCVIDEAGYPDVEVIKTRVVVAKLHDDEDNISQKAAVEGGPTYPFQYSDHSFQLCVYVMLYLADEPRKYENGLVSSYDDNWTYRFMLQYRKSNIWGSWWSGAGEVHSKTASYVTVVAYNMTDIAEFPNYLSETTYIPSFKRTGTVDFTGSGVLVSDCGKIVRRIHKFIYGRTTVTCNNDGAWTESFSYNVPEYISRNPDSRVLWYY